MNRRNRILSVVAAAVLILSLLATPATALTPPASMTCAGTMTVTPALYPPVLGPERSFSWSLQTLCRAVSPAGEETVEFDASGTGTGSCWRSVAFGGSGTLTTAAQTMNLSNIGWDSAGDVFVISGNHDAGGLGTFLAFVIASSGVDCLGPGQTSSVVLLEAWLA